MGQVRGKHDWTGVAYVTATLVGWASILLFLKQLAPYMDGWTSNGWRYGISAILWLPLLVVGGRKGTLPTGLWRRAVIPAFFNCVAQACFALTPYYIGPGLGGFLLRVSMVFSTGGALLLFADERPLVRSPAFWSGLMLVIAGSAGTIFMGSANIEGVTAIGIILGTCSGAVFGLYGLAVRHSMRGIPPMTSFAAISLYTAAGLVSLMVVVSPNHGRSVFDMTAFNWFLLVSSALIGIALGHVFYYAALERLGVATASGVIQLAPFLCAAGSWWLFGEELTAWQWGSGLVMLIGALMLLKAEQRRRQGMEVRQAAAPVELEDAGDPTALAEEPNSPASGILGWPSERHRSRPGPAACRDTHQGDARPGILGKATMSKHSILFVCTGNCFRSQMAEGLMRQMAGDRWDIRSAGSHPAGYVHPLAIAVMQEIGIDISGQESKGLDGFANREFDYVVTLCGHAQAACPTIRGRISTIHWPIEDPVGGCGSAEKLGQSARCAREEIRERLAAFIREVGGSKDRRPESLFT